MEYSSYDLVTAFYHHLTLFVAVAVVTFSAAITTIVMVLKSR